MENVEHAKNLIHLVGSPSIRDNPAKSNRRALKDANLMLNFRPFSILYFGFALLMIPPCVTFALHPTIASAASDDDDMLSEGPNETLPCPNYDIIKKRFSALNPQVWKDFNVGWKHLPDVVDCIDAFGRSHFEDERFSSLIKLAIVAVPYDSGGEMDETLAYLITNKHSKKCF